MKHEILPDGRLRITADDNDRQRLAEMKEEYEGKPFATCEAEALEPLVCNSELDWIPEGTTSDLTSAPMLGIFGEEVNEHEAAKVPSFGVIKGGSNGFVIYVQPVTHRWAYMSYQVRSFVDDLIDKGECIWEGGAAE